MPRVPADAVRQAAVEAWRSGRGCRGCRRRSSASRARGCRTPGASGSANSTHDSSAPRVRRAEVAKALGARQRVGGRVGTEDLRAGARQRVAEVRPHAVVSDALISAGARVRASSVEQPPRAHRSQRRCGAYDDARHAFDRSAAGSRHGRARSRRDSSARVDAAVHAHLADAAHDRARPRRRARCRSQR